MFLSFLTTTGANGDMGAGALGGSMASAFLPLVAIFVIFYFFLMRPQSKKQKETEKMINSLKKAAIFSPHFVRNATPDSLFAANHLIVQN